MLQDGAASAGRGSSGEEIAADVIVKGHAYSLISAKDVTADGRVWRSVQFRNLWGANSAAEYKGKELSDTSSGWAAVPRTQVNKCTVNVPVKKLWLFQLHTQVEREMHC